MLILRNFPFNISCLCVPTSSISSITSCDDYTWNGQTYISSGTYTWLGTYGNIVWIILGMIGTYTGGGCDDIKLND